jgi:hypothetical protein
VFVKLEFSYFLSHIVAADIASALPKPFPRMKIRQSPVWLYKLYNSITFEVKLPSACSFIVDGLAFFVDAHTTCFGLHGHLQVCMMCMIPSGIKSKISYTPEDGHVGRNM